jgi:predicted TIM-barrel fold metal-dependent hydrolase
MRHTGATRVVLVQPSVYGTDNSALIDSLDKLGSQARGVAGGLTHCIERRSN